MAYKRFKKLANITWKQKAWQKNTLMKAPIQLSNNSSISRPHPASWGQSYLPLWSSHAAAKYIPPWKASKVHQKSGIRPTVRSRLLPSLLHSPSFPTHALPHPSSTHAHNPLLSMLCLGVCPLFFFFKLLKTSNSISLSRKESLPKLMYCSISWLELTTHLH